MPLYVKPGREYILGGKFHASGEEVVGVPDKFVKILTSDKGPLTEEPPARKKPDLVDFTPPPAKTAEAPIDDAADDDEGDNTGAEDGDDSGADDIKQLRADYERVVGRRPFNGWSAEELRERMNQAGGASGGNS